MTEEEALALFGAMAVWELRRAVHTQMYPLGSRKAEAARIALCMREREEREERERRREQSRQMARERQLAEGARQQQARQEAQRRERERQRRQHQEDLQRQRLQRRLDAGIEQPLYLSHRAWQTYSEAEPSRQEEYKKELRKLSILPRTAMRKQVNKMERARGDCYVFPRGHQSVRLFFYQHSNVLRICEIASKYDGSYDDVWDRGVFKDQYRDGEFRLWHDTEAIELCPSTT